MTEPKWTPGPWQLRSEDLRGGRYWCVILPGCEESTDLHEDDNGEANSRLIAAAPELYEALAVMLGMLNTSENPGDVLFACKQARLALAKARGDG